MYVFGFMQVNKTLEESYDALNLTAFSLFSLGLSAGLPIVVNISLDESWFMSG